MNEKSKLQDTVLHSVVFITPTRTDVEQDQEKCSFAAETDITYQFLLHLLGF